MAQEQFSDKEMWMLHDRKISELQHNDNELEKKLDHLTESIRNLDDRINLGISPTNQKILEKQGSIEMLIAEIRSKFEISLVKIESAYERRIEKMEIAIEDQNDFLKNFKKIFVWGVLGAVILMVVSTALNFTFSRMRLTREDMIASKADARNSTQYDKQKK